uniref:Uncharacterized protein n=1 Tax=Periophthalmus magnuspinnatus TaxID=409849 RepID=A0A3B3ZJH5_9GOBI
MAAPSLSSVLTNANLTMYQSGVPDLIPPQHIGRTSPTEYAGNTSTCTLIQFYLFLFIATVHFGAWYEQASPLCWTLENVLEWISDNIEGTNFDARSLNLAYCALDGPSLCKMSQNDMIGVFGPQLGPHLHQSLLKHKAKHGKSVKEIFKVMCLPWLEIKSEKNVEEYCQKRRGRPPKGSRDHNSLYSPKKSKHAPRGTHLWEFIRDILIYPEKNHGLLKWEDRREGVFKFLKSEAVAQMWGQKKKNSSMTYEKLSRAMRYYYKRDILERVDGRRLVYKFGKNASGWKLNELPSVM